MGNKEVFKAVKDYEGHYEVSNFGRVNSLKGNEPKLLKISQNGHGYPVVTLSLNGKGKKPYVHLLVAIAFLDHVSNGHKLVINHIDGNRENNNTTNLEIITNRENLSKFRKDGKTLSSSYLGVTWHSQRSKWMARINIKGKSKALGLFSCEIEASKAYQKALARI